MRLNVVCIGNHTFFLNQLFLNVDEMHARDACINYPNESSFKCLKCSSTHNKNDFTENKSTESLIRFIMKDLSDNLDDEIKSTKDLLKGKWLNF